ncbi:uncharacterized protein [Bemisia tabaci]
MPRPNSPVFVFSGPEPSFNPRPRVIPMGFRDGNQEELSNDNGRGHLSFDAQPDNLSDQQLLLQELRNLRITMDSKIESLKSEIPVIVKGEMERNSSGSFQAPSPIRSLSNQSLVSMAQAPETQPQLNNSEATPRSFYYKVSPKDITPYNGDDEKVSPSEFVKSLDDFFIEARMSDTRKVAQAGRLLEGSAATWFRAYQSQIIDYSDFKSKFFHYFWSESKQAEIRASIYVPNQFRPEQGSMTNHFLGKVRKARSLDEPISDKAIISAVLQHFPHDVQWALIHSNANTVDLMIEKLRELDRIRPSSAAPFNRRNTQTGQNNQHAQNVRTMFTEPSLIHGTQPLSADNLN